MPDPKKRPRLSRLLVTLTWLCTIFGCAMFCVIPFAFDAPSSDKDLSGWRGVYWCLIIPVISIAGLRFGYAFEKRGKHKKAQLSFVVPIVVVLVFLTVCGIWQELWMSRGSI